MKTVKRYTAQFYRGNKFRFGLTILYTLLIGSVNLGTAWLMQQIIDRVAGTPGALPLGSLVWLSLALVLTMLLLKAVHYVVTPRFMEKAMAQYKEFAFQRLLDKHLSAFSKENTAMYLSAFSNDAASIETNYLERLFTLLFNGVLFVGALVMMLCYSPLMTLVACGFFLLPLGAVLLAGKKVELAERQISTENQGLMDALRDSLGGFSVIKSFQVEESIFSLLRTRNRAVESAKRKKRELITALNGLGGIAGFVAQFGTFLVGAWLALSGEMVTPGVLLIFIDLTAYVVNPIRDLPELLAARKAALALIGKLADALETDSGDQGVDISSRLNKGVALRDVTFGYERSKPILQNLNFDLEAGKSYAIVGPSGSGKSTLLNLLLATHPVYSGSITYDGAELRNVSVRSLYSLVSMVQQNVFVFNASIRENITMFRDFPKEQVDQAIALSGLSELITQRGEDYLCGENGSALSGGEKQRISIARSLLRKASVLMADEATAALDARTARQVSEAILGLTDMTRLVVTHALDASLLRQYDCILALKGGRLVEQGTFQELMEAKGFFYSLYTVSQT